MIKDDLFMQEYKWVGVVSDITDFIWYSQWRMKGTAQHMEKDFSKKLY